MPPVGPVPPAAPPAAPPVGSVPPAAPPAAPPVGPVPPAAPPVVPPPKVPDTNVFIASILILGLLVASTLSSEPAPPLLFPLEFLPESFPTRFPIPFIAKAPPAIVAKPAGVFALFNPNISFMNFSADVKKAIATIA